MSVDERARGAVSGDAIPRRGAGRIGFQLPAHVGHVHVRRGAETSHLDRRSEGSNGRLADGWGLAERNVNEGFSGGEKKRHEILQMSLLKPKIAILDETDSGLDVDALRVVSEGVNRFQDDFAGVLLITHYTRILRYITPDVVNVLPAVGSETGGPNSPRFSNPRATNVLRILRRPDGVNCWMFQLRTFELVRTVVDRRVYLDRP